MSSDVNLSYFFLNSTDPLNIAQWSYLPPPRNYPPWTIVICPVLSDLTGDSFPGITEHIQLWKFKIHDFEWCGTGEKVLSRSAAQFFQKAEEIWTKFWLGYNFVSVSISSFTSDWKLESVLLFIQFLIFSMTHCSMLSLEFMPLLPSFAAAAPSRSGSPSPLGLPSPSQSPSGVPVHVPRPSLPHAKLRMVVASLSVAVKLARWSCISLFTWIYRSL